MLQNPPEDKEKVSKNDDDGEREGKGAEKERRSLRAYHSPFDGDKRSSTLY